MIVKNEAAVIKRLLKSCLPVIDCICILDTGSADDTKAVIEAFADDYFIPCVVHSEAFVNFGVSRTRALQLAKGMADYILLLDADMMLDISAGFDKNFTAPGYLLQQGNDNFHYANVRLVRDDVAEGYFGVTHEHLVTKVPITDKLPWKLIDVGDGGSKADKFERDERLLRDGLLADPKNERYLFYLANTLFDTGKFEEAKDYYVKRVDVGGWDEEVFYSMYRAAVCFRRIGKHEEFVHHAFKAWAFRPSRIEAICELMNFYADQNNNVVSRRLYEIIRATPPSNDVLFVHRSCHVDADYRFTLLAFYLKETVDVFRVYADIFEAGHLNLYAQFNNYKFYCPIPIPKQVIDLAPMCELGALMPSTPCISTIGDHYLVNVRLVNYKLEGTRYIYDGCVRTENHMLELDKTFAFIGGKRLPQPDQVCDLYHGYEDVRMTPEGKFSCTWARANTIIGVSIGDYPAMLGMQHLKNKTFCEKNWVFLPDSKRMVYHWNPLKIGEVVGAELVISEEMNMPRLFEMARGSSNGVKFKEETWFVVHFVHQYEAEPRQYYHSLIVLDADLQWTKYTLPFKFSEWSVEYCLGIIVEADRIILSHSANDGSSQLSVYEPDAFDTLWVFKK